MAEPESTEIHGIRLPYVEIRRRTKEHDFVTCIRERKCSWAGHIARCGDDRWIRTTLGRYLDGSRYYCGNGNGELLAASWADDSLAQDCVGWQRKGGPAEGNYLLTYVFDPSETK